MLNDEIIQVKHVTMQFNLMEERVDTLKEYIVRLLKGRIKFNNFTALHDVSFSVKRGEAVGLIGHNGAGKSTMLKIIAGVLKPTSGSVVVKGSIAPLIEVGAGFDGELTARENIYLNGAMLGHSKQFIDDHFQSIVDFSELQQFIDVPVKNFSSGMYARLGFAIATEVQPDILIVDEVLSVGDHDFQQKCKKRIKHMMDTGTTVIFVSHDIETIKEVCNRVIWFEKGQCKGKGTNLDICNTYECEK